MHRVAAAFRLLLGLRWLDGEPGESTPFSRRFASRWCGLTERRAEDAIDALLAVLRIARS